MSQVRAPAAVCAGQVEPFPFGMPLAFKSGFRYRRCLSPGGSSSIFVREKLFTHHELWNKDECVSDADTQESEAGDQSDEDDLVGCLGDQSDEDDSSDWGGGEGEVLVGCRSAESSFHESFSDSGAATSSVCASSSSSSSPVPRFAASEETEERYADQSNCTGSECDELREKLRTATGTVADLQRQLQSTENCLMTSEAQAGILRDRVDQLEDELAVHSREKLSRSSALTPPIKGLDVKCLDESRHGGYDRSATSSARRLFSDPASPIMDSPLFDWSHIVERCDGSEALDARRSARGAEFFMMTPGAADPHTPGASSVLSEVPSELWLYPPASRSASQRDDIAEQIAEQLSSIRQAAVVVEQPIPPKPNLRLLGCKHKLVTSA